MQLMQGSCELGLLCNDLFEGLGLMSHHIDGEITGAGIPHSLILRIDHVRNEFP